MANVANDDFADEYLAAFASAQHGELVLALDAVLQSAELFLLGVIVEGSHKDDDYDGDQNGEALDPLVRFILLMTFYKSKSGNKTIKSIEIYQRS